MLVDRFIKVMRRDAAGDEGDKGGGTGTPPATPSIADLQKQIADLTAAVSGLTKPPVQTLPTGDDDLASKAKKEQETRQKDLASQATMEKAILFNTKVEGWVKDNASLLPKSIGDILVQANKETFDSQSEKANAIKIGIVNEFFNQQANLDLLTATQKNQLDEFEKLTKNEKQNQVQNLFDNIFEPTFENKVRTERAIQIAKGHGNKSTNMSEYEQRVIEQSRKKYLKI